MVLLKQITKQIITSTDRLIDVCDNTATNNQKVQRILND